MASDSLSSCRAETEELKKMWKGHVMAVPWPAQGHINPMMHLSKNLAAHGVLVTFINTQFNHDLILEARHGASSETEPEGNIRFVGIPDGLGYDEYVANFSVPKQAQALLNLEPLLVDMVDRAQPPVTCIIADVFVNSTLAVARRFHIPHVGLWTQSAACYASHVFFGENHASLKDHLEKLINEGRVAERVISSVPSCPRMSYKEIPTFLQPCDPSNFIFSYFTKSLQLATQHTFVLINTFEELEVESLAYIHAPNILCIGPLLPYQFILSDTKSPLVPKRNIPTVGTSFWVEDDKLCLSWLNQQKPRSVLYVSFGSITLMSTQQAAHFAFGLEASGCPFLMVVRPGLMEGGISIGFPEGFVNRVRDSGQAIFVAWAPQLEVLAHPAIGGFLSHAGWNSTLESICKGVPMLCWPYFGDQMLNARCIVDTWRVGLEFITEKVSNNEQWKSTNSGGNIDDVNSSNEEDGNCEQIALVKWEEVEEKIRQLMDPLTSIEIRKQAKIFSLAATKAYGSSCPLSFKSLLNVTSC